MLSRPLVPVLLAACGLVALTPPAQAQEEAPKEAEAAPVPEHRAWPKTVRVAGRDVALYEPAVLSHDQATGAVTLRLATEVTDAIGRKGYGVVDATATAHADLRGRVVRLTGIAMTGAKLPSVAEADREEVLGGLGESIPKSAHVRLELLTCRPAAGGPPGTEPKFKSDPPKIHLRRTPAVLVQIDGEPLLYNLQNFPIRYVANTAADLFHKPSSGDWWMLIDGRWAHAKAMAGPWEWLATRVPVELTQLKIGHPRGHVRQFIPGTPEYKKRGAPESVDTPPMPEVIISQEPAELVSLYGDPLFTMISPTVKLMSVANTDSDLLFHPKEGRFYLLIGGRWFVADDLAGGWKPAYGRVPKEFAEIPSDHRLAHVLASVPGTPENAEAVALIALEERATLKKQIRLDVRHADKKLRSVPMSDSKAKRVTSSEDDVFEAGDGFFACGNGAWFRSDDGIGSFQPVIELPASLQERFSAASGYFHDGFCRPVGEIEGAFEYAISGGYLGAFVRGGLPKHGTGWSEVGLARNQNWYPRPRTYGENRWFDVQTGVFQPRNARYDDKGDLVATIWSDYTASYGRVDEYGDRYEQGGRRQFPFTPSNGEFRTLCGRPHPYADWAGYMIALNGIPAKELPLADRRNEPNWEGVSLIADADGNVFRSEGGKIETWTDGKWAAAEKPPGAVEDWVRVYARINTRAGDLSTWARKRRAARPVNAEVTK